MKKLLIVLTTMVILTGCAGMGGNEAYTAAHKVAADSRTAESNNRAKAEEARVLAAASMAKTCKDDVCRAMGFMALMQFGGGVSPTNTPAPVIAPPVNEALEIGKLVSQTLLGGYGLRLNFGATIAGMARGAADSDILKETLKLGDVYNDATTSK